LQNYVCLLTIAFGFDLCDLNLLSNFWMFMKDMTLVEARCCHGKGGAVVARFMDGTEYRLMMIGGDEVVVWTGESVSIDRVVGYRG
jgi:hypothetical protein